MKLAVATMTVLVWTRVAQAQPDQPAPVPPPSAPAETPTATPAETPIEPPPEPTTPGPTKVEPAALPAAPTSPAQLPPTRPTPEPRHDDRGFRFGSYGRLIAGTDLRGGKPEAVNVVAHGPRIVEPSYLELDMSYGFETPSGKKLRTVVTLAFDGTLFHDTGDFDAQPALRNMYLDAQLYGSVNAWVGSRMYRGDDIYLFDYWPLDDLNTVGGGFYRRNDGNGLAYAFHGGVNRLNNDFQFQTIDVPDPEQGATTAVQLNRQRFVASGTISYLIDDLVNNLSLKAKVHGEIHALASGTRKRDDGTLEDLPSDRGDLFGLEVSAFDSTDHSPYRNHLNLYVRYASGLAAYDELAPPTSFGPDLKTDRANELTLGAAGNFDHRLGNVMLGALTRRFVDADSSSTDPDDGWEYAVDVRPLARVVPDIFVGADISYQARFPRGLNPNTQTAEDPAVFQIAPMIVFSPMGPSSYDRPQLRLVYRAAHLNQAARDEYVPDDVRGDHTWVHFLGVQAEWWFNSSTYR